MTKSSFGEPLGIVRSTAVISLGLVALAGSLATALCRRIVTAPTSTAKPQMSKLVIDEWEAELSRLRLPARREVEEMQKQLGELEKQIDQLGQRKSHSKEGA